MGSFKLVKRRKVRGRIKHFFEKSVSLSFVLFTVATSCKLWIVRVAHREESLSNFIKEISNKKNVVLLEGNIDVIQNFCLSCLINKNSVPLVGKETFVFWRY